MYQVKHHRGRAGRRAWKAAHMCCAERATGSVPGKLHTCAAQSVPRAPCRASPHTADSVSAGVGALLSKQQLYTTRCTCCSHELCMYAWHTHVQLLSEAGARPCTRKPATWAPATEHTLSWMVPGVIVRAVTACALRVGAVAVAGTAKAPAPSNKPAYSSLAEAVGRVRSAGWPGSTVV